MITGELGVGKTLTLTYLAWNNYYYKKRKIGANYTIYGMPFYPIKTVKEFFWFIPPKTTNEEILKGEEKAFFGDDFWKWIGTQTLGLGTKKKSEIIKRILMASRKSFVTVFYTTQLARLIKPEIRQVTDLMMKPTLSPDKSYCKVYVYGLIEGKYLQPLQPLYFNTEPIIAMYNTYEVAFDAELDINIEEEDFLEPPKGFEIVEEFIPIEKNPAWMKYCRDILHIDINSKEFKKKCDEIQRGLGIELR
ncbi:MAG: hypothetical protein QW795_03520 [Candidatus Bathyarchaeia archaeon]